MARARYSDVAFSYDGLIVNRVPNASITLYIAGTTTPLPDTIWKNATGTGPSDEYTNPFTTDETGLIEFYLDTPKSVKIVATGTLLGTLTSDYAPVMPDPSEIMTSGKGGVIYLMDYAGGQSIGDGIVSCDTAFATADAAAVALGRTTIVIPPGTFPVKYVPTSGTTLLGDGKGSTILKQQDGDGNANYRFPIVNCIGKTDVTLKGISFDGNYTQNNGVQYTGTAVALDGDRCRMVDCEVYDFNHTGVTYGATDVVLENVDAYRNSPPTTYPVSQGTGASADYGGIYGFSTPSNTRPVRVRLINCRAWNMRSAGVVIGGPDPRIDNFVGWELHRGPFPYETAPGSVATPGGNVATAMTWNGSTSGAGANDPANQTVRCTGLVITTPKLGPTANLAYAQGIEISTADRVEIVAPIIKGLPSIAIKVSGSTDVTILGGTLDGANPGGTAGVYGIYGDNGGTATETTNLRVFGTSVKNMTSYGVVAGNASDYWTLQGMHWDNPSGTNWFPGSIVHLESGGHHVKSGGAVPQQTNQTLTVAAGSLAVSSGLLSVVRNVTAVFASTVQQLHATGYGQQVIAQSGGVGQWVARFLSNGGSKVVLDLLANGQALHRSIVGNVVTFDTEAAAAVNAMLTLTRSAAAKVSIGLDASDFLAIIGAAGAKVLTVDPANGRLLSLSGGASTDAWLSLGRTAMDGLLAIPGTVGNVFTAAAVGDMALRADTGDLLLGTLASKVVKILTNNTVRATIDTSGNLTLTGDLTVSGGVYTTMATPPTLVQGGSAIAATVNYARYKQIGKWAHVMVSFTVTNNTNAVASNIVKIVLPSSSPALSSARSGNAAVAGSAVYFVSGTGWRSGSAIFATGTDVQFARDGKANFFGSVSDPHPDGSAKVQVNDIFAVDLEYELA